jgi:HlyD family secretion protein
LEATATSVEPGVVKAKQDSVLAAPVSGRIVEVYHKKGDRVAAGEKLIRLENDLERIALAEAKLELERLDTLGPQGAAAKELLDRARFAVERATTHYDRTFVCAPFGGVIIELNANLGEMSYGTMPLDVVLGGKKGNTAESLVRMIDDSEFYVEADIDEADAGRLEIGQHTRVTVDALEGRVLEGKLIRISPAVSTAEGRSRTVRVEIGLAASGLSARPCEEPSAGVELLVGMSADIEVILERAEGVLVVPTLVILEGQSEKSVFVVEGGKLARREVTLGLASWELSEVKEGLREGDLVVIPIDRSKLLEGLAVEVDSREEAPRP